jgi:integrase/recombinase XerD
MENEIMSGTRRKPGELGPHMEGFQSRLLLAGYTPDTTRNMLKVVGQLGRWLAVQGLTVADFDEDMVAVFVAARRAAGYRQVQYRGVFIALLSFLREEGVVPAVVPAAPSVLEALVQQYRRWLIDERDLAAATVLRYENLARRFLISSDEDTKLIDLDTLRGTQVSAFMLAESRRVSLGSARGRVAELRSLLRYLYLFELIGLNLAVSVPSVAGWRDAGLPISVSVADVENMVASCDCSLTTGRRDRAILLLLARLGLRSIEVARLELDDVDWRAGEIVVRGKARRRDRLPLPVDVGEALVSYLRDGRPVSPHRQLFVTERAPRRPIPAALVGDVVRRASRRTGSPVVRAHRLRHALATDLLKKGASLVDISQVLRHRDLATTAIYAKVDLVSLRSVAQPWPGQSR